MRRLTRLTGWVGIHRCAGRAGSRLRVRRHGRTPRGAAARTQALRQTLATTSPLATDPYQHLPRVERHQQNNFGNGDRGTRTSRGPSSARSPASCTATSTVASSTWSREARLGGHVSQPHAVTTHVPAAEGSRCSSRSATGTRSPSTCGWWPAVTRETPRAVTCGLPRYGPASLRTAAPAIFEVLGSQQTARQFGLHVGSKVQITGRRWRLPAG